MESLDSGRMSWGEAWRLAEVLAGDPSSRTCAAINGWDYPMSAEAIVLADLFDLWTTADAAPYKRPWPPPGSKALGKGTQLTPAEFKSRWKELSEKAEQRRLASAPQD